MGGFDLPFRNGDLHGDSCCFRRSCLMGLADAIGSILMRSSFLGGHWLHVMAYLNGRLDFTLDPRALLLQMLVAA